ncbi:D-amino-acid transaminase [Bacillus sp. FJAT-45350]|uniref:D-amino-acid transaminase n=1 Tax=Bacillus sp. FJAT-45350 TaxID=2011014 RepID=UPI000BB8119B|nr:D-amino-acid transaminase [Bacillus sp. FJAT-45350]
MGYVLYQDELIKKEDAKIDFDDRGYYFGDGIYEVMRIYEGIPFALDEHLERFFTSAKKLDIDATYTKEGLITLIKKLIDKNKLINGIVYLQMTRNISPRTHLYERNRHPVLTGFTSSIEGMSKPSSPIDVWMTPDIRWLRCDIKTINLLGNVLAKRLAADHNCTEALQHRDGTVTEGSSSNLFIVKDNRIYTHPATNLILNGITRQIVITLAKQLDIPVVEEPFTLAELREADEVFATSTSLEVTSIKKIMGDIEANFHHGEITKKLEVAYTERVEIEIRK